MDKRRISIFEYKEHDILATEVVNEYGVLIAVENTQMNSYIKNKLIEHKIFDVYVFDHNGLNVEKIEDNPELVELNYDYKNSIVGMKNIIMNLVTGKGLDVNEFHNITRLIIGKIEQSPNIIQCIHNIKMVDEYTYTHCINTAFYAMLIGKWMKFSENEINKVVQAGLLHDIGKTKISEEIFNKKGILTKVEYEIMKQHTVLGYAILQGIDEIDPDVKCAALLHHERIDCSGYPFNASYESVGLLARIIAVADVYDAMTTDRVYKKRSTPFDAFSMFTTVGVGLFDTTIMFTFLKNIATYYVGMKVLLSNGETGEIVFIPPQDIAHPIIKTNEGYLDFSCEKVLNIVSIH